MEKWELKGFTWRPSPSLYFSLSNLECGRLRAVTYFLSHSAVRVSRCSNLISRAAERLFYHAASMLHHTLLVPWGGNLDGHVTTKTTDIRTIQF